MLSAVTDWLTQRLATRCHLCDTAIDDASVRADVKVPGYTGRHEKAFCSEAHLDAWKRYVTAWEAANYEIPPSNTGPACGGC